MAFYCGIDLHASNSYVAIVDQEGRDIVCRRVQNRLDVIQATLQGYRDELVGVGVESTFNWYWLVDGLMDAGYPIHLLNTTQAETFRNLKYRDDRHDARWIATLLRFGVFPDAYILPKEERPYRDLLRRRMLLVQARTRLLQSINSTYQRHHGRGISTGNVGSWNAEILASLFPDPAVAESVAVMLPVVRVLERQVRSIEQTVEEHAKLRPEFQLLTTAPGIGTILALVIMYETGDIGRFPTVGHYASYCRCVPSRHVSNGRRKGSGNRKNGNKYLSWAYSEAALHAARVDPRARQWRDRKRARSHPMVAWRALASKMVRGCYWVLRRQVPFDSDRAF